MAHSQSQQPCAQGIADDHERVRELLDALAAQVSRRAPDVDCIGQCLRDLKRLDLPHRVWESEFFFPRVRQRCPALAPVLDRLEAEHDDLELLYAELVTELKEWGARGPAERRAVIARLERFARFALGHIEVEESYVVPVASDFLTADDWIDIGRPGGLQTTEALT